MPEPADDPRRRGFGAPLRPLPSARPRGITAPPPPKPVVEPVQVDVEAPAAPVVEKVRPTPPMPMAAFNRPDEERQLGTQRHRMRYVQFQVTAELSELLTGRAEDEGVVLGEVLMDAISAQGERPADEQRRRRRREPVAVRRQVLLRPEEADRIAELAKWAGETPSALIRRSLKEYLR